MNQVLQKLTKDGLHSFDPVTGLNILDTSLSLPTPTPVNIAIEVTKKCSKECNFCYAGSTPVGESRWTKDELIRFCHNLTGRVFTINLGGGEPFEYAGIVDVLNSLKTDPVGISVTTNGLLLEKYLTEIQPNPRLTITISLHAPEEIEFVTHLVRTIHPHFKTNVNVLLRHSKLALLKEIIPGLIPISRLTFLNFNPFGLGKGQEVITSNETLSSAELLLFLKSVGLDSAYVSSCEPVPEGIESVYPTCGALRRWMTVTADKIVKPCSFSPTGVPLSDISYRSLINTIPPNQIPCWFPAETKKASRLTIWLGNLSTSHSVDSNFWAITDTSVAKFSTGENGVLPDWPELDQYELLDNILAENLDVKERTIKLKPLLVSCRQTEYWDYQVVISDLPWAKSSVSSVFALSLPEIKFYRYGIFFTDKVTGFGKSKRGLHIYKIDSDELIEKLVYFYFAIGPNGSDIQAYKEAYKEGYIDECGNEISYGLNNKPAIKLKYLAPKLFHNLRRRLNRIKPVEIISLAGEEYEGYNNEVMDGLKNDEASSE